MRCNYTHYMPQHEKTLNYFSTFRKPERPPLAVSIHWNHQGWAQMNTDRRKDLSDANEFANR